MNHSSQIYTEDFELGSFLSVQGSLILFRSEKRVNSTHLSNPHHTLKFTKSAVLDDPNAESFKTLEFLSLLPMYNKMLNLYKRLIYSNKDKQLNSSLISSVMWSMISHL